MNRKIYANKINKQGRQSDIVTPILRVVHCVLSDESQRRAFASASAPRRPQLTD